MVKLSHVGIGSLVFMAIFGSLRSVHAQGVSAHELFEERIKPIFASPNPSSCVECHLAGVDLKDYILPSAEATFANLRDLKLIDMKRPNESRILELIGMKPDGAKGQSINHMTQKMRDAEYKAFADWIEASVADESMRQLPAFIQRDRDLQFRINQQVILSQEPGK